MTHSWRDVEDKVKELRNMTIDEMAEAILSLEIQLDECGGKLADALERLDEAEDDA